MAPEKLQQIKDLFAAALEVSSHERAVFLVQACGTDVEVRREVESLLSFEAQAENFIEKPALAVAAELMAEDKAAALTGKQITHYRVLKPLGAGGMGEVYLAEDSSLGRQVALKLLPLQFTADVERVRRFALEAKAASGRRVDLRGSRAALSFAGVAGEWPFSQQHKLDCRSTPH